MCIEWMCIKKQQRLTKARRLDPAVPPVSALEADDLLPRDLNWRDVPNIVTCSVDCSVFKHCFCGELVSLKLVDVSEIGAKS